MKRYPVDVNRAQFDARAVIVLPDDFYDYVGDGPSVYVITDAELPELAERIVAGIDDRADVEDIESFVVAILRGERN